MSAFSNLIGAIQKARVVDVKTKELIAVGIATYNRCEYCIVAHVHGALSAGCTPEEIMEAALVAMGYGGGPSMAYAVTLVRQSIEEFAPDFQK